jgi:hypothetical protein
MLFMLARIDPRAGAIGTKSRAASACAAAWPTGARTRLGSAGRSGMRIVRREAWQGHHFNLKMHLSSNKRDIIAVVSLAAAALAVGLAGSMIVMFTLHVLQ